ncbi:MAG TPA: hypothetical protein VGJ26_07550 [Pirellulales bacterium]|jgi:hypothetical protein
MESIRSLRVSIIASLVILFLVGFANAANIQIPTVHVGDAGNPNDPSTGNQFGKVGP